MLAEAICGASSLPGSDFFLTVDNSIELWCTNRLGSDLTGTLNVAMLEMSDPHKRLIHRNLCTLEHK